MHYMDMNEAYRCLDGICGAGSCLSRPISTLTWHQMGLFDCEVGYPVQGFYAVRPDSRGKIAPKLILFCSMIVEKPFYTSK